MQHFTPVSFSPFFHNILDFIDRKDLVTIRGTAVSLRRSGIGFVAEIGGLRYETNDNISMSAYLNDREVGIKGD